MRTTRSTSTIATAPSRMPSFGRIPRGVRASSSGYLTPLNLTNAWVSGTCRDNPRLRSRKRRSPAWKKAMCWFTIRRRAHTSAGWRCVRWQTSLTSISSPPWTKPKTSTSRPASNEASTRPAWRPASTSSARCRWCWSKWASALPKARARSRSRDTCCNPRVLFRLARGFVRSKLERRKMLPRDLWTLKALPLRRR